MGCGSNLSLCALWPGSEGEGNNERNFVYICSTELMDLWFHLEAGAEDRKSVQWTMFVLWPLGC